MKKRTMGQSTIDFDQSEEIKDWVHRNIRLNVGTFIYELLEAFSASAILHDLDWYIDLFLQMEKEDTEDEDFYDPQTREPFEFYAVSPYLASVLENKGMLITYHFSVPVWGRETTGQLVYMDHAIQEAWYEYNLS